MNDAPILLDGAVNAALLRALAKDPKARFGSCEEFVESCLAQSPRSPQRESRTEEQRPGASNPEGPQVPKTAAALESDVLRRKLAFAREQAERKAKEEAERVARERAESELKAKKEGGPSRTGEPQGGGGLQSAVGANGGLETAAPLAGTRTVVRVGSQEIAMRWCPPGSFLKTQREGSLGLALRSPDRGAVGIRLPGGDARRVRRERSPRRHGVV